MDDTLSVPILSPGRDRFRPLMLLKAGPVSTVTMVMQLADSKPRTARLFHQPPGVEEGAFLTALDREATRLRPISHPNISRFDRVVEGEGGTWLFFEFIPGSPLSLYLGQEHTIPDAWVASWFADILGCLQTLHEQQPPLVVGYVEPRDLLLDEGRLCLADLGLFEHMFPEQGVRLLRDHPWMHFIAPERRNSALTNPRNDLFSAAAVAFWLATGKAPCIRSPQAAGHHVTALLQARPQFPQAIAELIGDALNFYPSQRPSSARLMLERLLPHLPDRAGQQPPPFPDDPECFKFVAPETLPMGVVEKQIRAVVPSPLAVPVEAPTPVLPSASQELFEDLWWVVAHNRILQAILCGVLLVVLLALLRGLQSPPVAQSLLTVREGAVLRQVSHPGMGDAPWKAVNRVLPGMTLAVRQAHATLGFGDGSTLVVKQDTILQCLGRSDDDGLQLKLEQGVLEARTRAHDRLHLTLPAGSGLHLEPGTVASIDASGRGKPPAIVIKVQHGEASLELPDGTHDLTAGATARVSLDGKRLLPASHSGAMRRRLR
ncbi:MAG: protein kinase domain-containing protein [Candidatus Xenobia bacterium]